MPWYLPKSNKHLRAISPCIVYAEINKLHLLTVIPIRIRQKYIPENNNATQSNIELEVMNNCNQIVFI